MLGIAGDQGSLPNLIFKTTNHDHTPCTSSDNRRVIIPPSTHPHLMISSSMLSSSSSSSSGLRSFSELQLMQEKFSPSCPAAGRGELAPACFAACVILECAKSSHLLPSVAQYVCDGWVCNCCMKNSMPGAAG
jgi:hypothetical protein